MKNVRWKSRVWSLLVATAGLAMTAVAQQEVAAKVSFAGSLARAHQAMEAREWDEVLAALDEALAASDAREVAPDQRAVVERIHRLATFELGYRAPEIDELVPGEVRRYDARRGHIQVRYDEKSLEPYRLKADEDAEWKEKVGIARRQPTQYLHPAAFDTFTLEARGPTYKPALIGVALSSDGGYHILPGGSVRDAVYPSEVVRLEGGRETTILHDEWQVSSDERKAKRECPLWDGVEWELEIKVKKRRIYVRGNGEKVFTVAKKPEETGQLLLQIPSFEELTIDGYVDPAWIESLFDQHRRARLDEFSKDYDPRRELPAWLFTGDDRQVAGSRLQAKIEHGPEWSNRFVEESEHYVVASDLDQQVCRDACRLLETGFRYYRRAFGTRDIAPPAEKFKVYVFASSAGFDEYVGDVLGDTPLNAAGLYSPGLKQLLIWNLPARRDMYRTIRHEGFHQYLDTVIDRPPVWLNEGFADYFEVAATDAGRPVPGAIQDRHVRSMRATWRSRLTVEDILKLQPRTFYRSPEVNYAFSWALVRFFEENKYTHGKVLEVLLDELLDEQAAGTATRRAMEAADMAELEAEFEAYLRELVK